MAWDICMAYKSSLVQFGRWSAPGSQVVRSTWHLKNQFSMSGIEKTRSKVDQVP